MKTIKTAKINKFSKMVCALAILALTFSACKKDEQITPDPTPEPVPEKVATLSSGNWTLETMTINGNDVINYIDDCERDDITTFKTDGTYVTDEGATKCDPKDKQTTDGVWEFTDNYTKMVIDKDDVKYVTLLTKEKLEVRDTIYEDGNMEILNITFINKK